VRVLAIDYGTVRVGTALCDELGMFATPYRVLPADRNLPEEIARIVRDNGVDHILLGMPYALDGSQTDTTRRVKAFAEKLRALLPCPIVEWDESFSSRTAVSKMIGSGVSRKKRRQKGTTDTWAAAILLQEYLDSLR
jgi:putative Holliday junction resolvase